MVLLDLLCLIFLVRDLSYSPKSFGFIDTQLMLTDVKIDPKLIDTRDIAELFMRPNTSSFTRKRPAQYFEMGLSEKLTMGSAAFLKLLASGMLEMLEEAASFVRDFMAGLRIVPTNNRIPYFANEQTYLKKVKENIDMCRLFFNN